MLESDGADPGAVLSFSLASDIVELVIFTTDEIFLQTLREAVGDSRRLWHVPSADKVSDLLLAGEVGILVLDVQALPDAASVFVTQIKRQFPELVVIVAGNREAETSLGNLIMAGTIYRFIHKPMSPARAKLFTDAAVKKYDEQRTRSPVPPDVAWVPTGNRRLLIGAAVGALLVGMTAIWALRHGNRESRVANDNAPDPYSQELARDPPDATPRAGAAEVHERLLAQAENALLEERLDEAARAIDAARKAGVDAGRIAFLTAQLAKARERLKEALAQAAQRRLLPAQASVVEEAAGRFLNLAAERMKEGRLTEPAEDSARFYVAEALRIDPNGNATQAAQQTLARSLLAEVHIAIDRRDMTRAASLLDNAEGIAAASNVQNLRQLLSAARKQADTGAGGTLPKIADAPERQDRPIESGDNSAKPADDSTKTAESSAAARGLEAAPTQGSVANVVSAAQLTLVKSVTPVYPARAERTKTEGWVELDFTVTESGEVAGITVRAASPVGMFDSAAIAALSQWRYKPVLEQGKPTAQHSRIRIRFTLSG